MAAFEKQTGITVNLRSRRRGRAGRPDRDRGFSFAGRRVLHGELTALAVPGLEGAAGRRRLLDARQHAVPLQLPGRAVGRGLGPGERDGLQHVALDARPAPDVGHGAGRPRVERQDRHRRSETDFQPIVTTIARTYGEAAALRWLDAVKAQRGEPRLPGQRDGHVGGQQRPGGPRRSSTSTTGTASGPRSGAAGMHSAIAYFAPHDVGYVVDVSGAGILKSSIHQADGPAVPGLPDLVAGPGDHRPQRQLRVPDRIGGHDRAARDAVRPAPAERDHDRRAGHGRRGDQAAAGGAAAVSAASGGWPCTAPGGGPCRRC